VQTELGPLAQGREDLVVLREAIQLLFGKDEFAVNFHFKNTAPRSDQFGIQGESFTDCVRQTGGAR